MDTFSANQVPAVPPPPSAVKVRTMRSDIESMAKSGGGSPKFENVKVVLAQGPQGKKTLVAVMVIIAIAVLAIVGWFAYANFFSGALSQVPQTQQQATPSPTPISPYQAQSDQVVVPTTTPPGTVPILKLSN